MVCTELVRVKESKVVQVKRVCIVGGKGLTGHCTEELYGLGSLWTRVDPLRSVKMF